MIKDEEILELLLSGGFIGTTLGDLLAKNGKGETLLSTVAGAALFGTYRAGELARRTNIPVLSEQNGYLYRMFPDGTRKVVRKLENTKTNLPKQFTLK